MYEQPRRDPHPTPPPVSAGPSGPSYPPGAQQHPYGQQYGPPAQTPQQYPVSPAAGYPAAQQYAQQYPQPYGQPLHPQPVYMVQKLPTSGWAVAALIFGIFSVLAGWCTFAVPSIAAVICGHAGLRDTNGGVKAGRGMAIAGLILGYPLVALIAIGLVTGTLGSFTSP